ncbi:MAG: hypothetical protein WCP21_20650, partial [Armatimonadota bacterium]
MKSPASSINGLCNRRHEGSLTGLVAGKTQSVKISQGGMMMKTMALLVCFGLLMALLGGCGGMDTG